MDDRGYDADVLLNLIWESSAKAHILSTNRRIDRQHNLVERLSANSSVLALLHPVRKTCKKCSRRRRVASLRL